MPFCRIAVAALLLAGCSVPPEEALDVQEATLRWVIAQSAMPDTVFISAEGNGGRLPDRLSDLPAVVLPTPANEEFRMRVAYEDLSSEELLARRQLYWVGTPKRGVGGSVRVEYSEYLNAEWASGGVVTLQEEKGKWRVVKSRHDWSAVVTPNNALKPTWGGPYISA